MSNLINLLILLGDAKEAVGGQWWFPFEQGFSECQAVFMIISLEGE